jgi:hypothetical protein
MPLLGSLGVGSAKGISVGDTPVAFVQSGLVLNLDAANYTSGTTWASTVGGVNFSILASAYNSSGPKYMDFNGSFGCAKKTDSDFLVSGDVTVTCWTRVRQTNTNWRTLLRGLSSGGDHQVIFEAGSYRLGMYDNQNATGYNDSTFLQTSLPGWNTGRWNMMTWRWNNGVTPYYSFSYNDTPSTLRGSNNSINTRFKHGFCSIGAYNNGVQTDPSNADQYWGDIAHIAVYNRYLSDSEVLSNFQTSRNRYGV